MSAFPPLAPCTACAQRWPAPVLDNLGRCPICGLDGVPRRRDLVRRMVRVIARDLVAGDTVQPWNQRTAPHRTVRMTVVGDAHSGVLISWTDGTDDIVPAHTVYHRSNVRL